MTLDPDAPPSERIKERFGLTGSLGKPRERVPIRTRGSGATLSAWRLEVACDQGQGVIVVAEVSPEESYFSSSHDGKLAVTAAPGRPEALRR